jgi:uncharacterized membrane protein (UPF0127 family)
MYLIKNNIYFIKVFLKVTLSIICYLLFTIYTIPAYKNVRAYVDQKVNTRTINVVLGTAVVRAQIVDTPESRKNGLSNREPLKEDEGMLFIFEEMEDHGIWMKDMKFSIDILWLNEYGEVLHYVEEASPDSYPEVFSASQNSKYVLEIQAGSIKREGIKLGDKIDLY